MLVWTKPEFERIVKSSLPGIDAAKRETVFRKLQSGVLEDISPETIRDSVMNIEEKERRILRQKSEFDAQDAAQSSERMIMLPAPVLINVAGGKLLFSGFDMVAFAYKYSAPLKVWSVDWDKEENEQDDGH